MCHVDDNWADKAMNDATLVANLLLQIKNTTTTTTKATTTSSPSFNLKWTVRQRRSRFNRQVRVYNKTEKPNRASPTTPLSWTAAASPSGTASGPFSAAAVADGSEESSRLFKTVNTSRSNKIDEQSETATAYKRSRKKRSLPELLEEEKSLLKERRTLKDELASMNLTLEKQKAKNESLKKLKLDLVSQQSSSSMVSGKAVLSPPQLVSHHSDSSKPASPQQTVQENGINDELVVHAASSSAQQQINNQEQEPLFLLPDLNLPPEEEFNENS